MFVLPALFQIVLFYFFKGQKEHYSRFHAVNVDKHKIEEEIKHGYVAEKIQAGIKQAGNGTGSIYFQIAIFCSEITEMP
jgi:hypothetical protein